MLRVGFCGAGRMAGALMQGLQQAPVLVSCYDRDPLARAAAEKRGALVLGGNAEVDFQSDVLIIGVKPQDVVSVCRELEGDALVVSLAAGVKLETLKRTLPGRRVARAMPNTPCQLGQGASAWAAGPDLTQVDRQILHDLLGSVGVAFEIREAQMDVVTGLSGSGPAYVYRFIEALTTAGVRLGLEKNVAATLAASTVRGAADVALNSTKSPAQLASQVASPGGTTAAALTALERGAFDATVQSAVEAGAVRARRLG